MQSLVQKHYQDFLAEHYTWMFGSFEDKVAEQEVIFKSNITSGMDKRAVDLGCGPGFQSIALAQMGFQVTAIDTDECLLNELKQHKGLLNIDPIQADLRQVSQLVEPNSADLVVCMGDTLTHLAEFAEISRLFQDVTSVLSTKGTFVVSFRDLSKELLGTERFIPVRSSADKILTCFLEYQKDRVQVHDLLYWWDGQMWQLKKSSYPKLRLSVGWVMQTLHDAGLKLSHQELFNGLWTICARKF
jgi:SAM-dependent methyltransferase